MFSRLRLSTALCLFMFEAVSANSASPQQVPMSLKEAVHASSAIFSGRVIGSRSRWGTPQKRWISTEFSFLVDEVFLSSADKSVQKGRTALLTYPGGTVDGETQAISGQIVPLRGQRYVVFLSANFGKPGHHPVVGDGHGLFKLVQDKRGSPVRVVEAHGAPLRQLPDGSIVRDREVENGEHKPSAVTVDQFARWLKQTISSGKTSPSSPPQHP